MRTIREYYSGKHRNPIGIGTQMVFDDRGDPETFMIIQIQDSVVVIASMKTGKPRCNPIHVVSLDSITFCEMSEMVSDYAMNYMTIDR